MMVTVLMGTVTVAAGWLLLRLDAYQPALLQFADARSRELWRTINTRTVWLICDNELDLGTRETLAGRMRGTPNGQHSCAFLHVKRSSAARHPNVRIVGHGDDYTIDVTYSRSLGRVVLATLLAVQPDAVFISLNARSVGNPRSWFRYAITVDGDPGFVLRNYSHIAR